MVSSPVAADQAARAKRRILVAASLVTSLSMLDSNIVAVSLPPISNVSHLPKAAIGLLQAVADGEVTPDEAGEMPHGLAWFMRGSPIMAIGPRMAQVQDGRIWRPITP